MKNAYDEPPKCPHCGERFQAKFVRYTSGNPELIVEWQCGSCEWSWRFKATDKSLELTHQGY